MRIGSHLAKQLPFAVRAAALGVGDDMGRLGLVLVLLGPAGLDRGWGGVGGLLGSGLEQVRIHGVQSDALRRVETTRIHEPATVRCVFLPVLRPFCLSLYLLVSLSAVRAAESYREIYPPTVTVSIWRVQTGLLLVL